MPPEATDQLRVPIVVGGAPASPNGVIPATPGRRAVLRVDKTEEYVGTTGWRWYGQYLRTLPPPIDDIAQEWGADVYERMARDAQVAADIQRMKAAILEDGVRLSNVVRDKTADGFGLGKQIAELFQSNLNELETSIDDALWNLLDALLLGNRVAEQTYRVEKIQGKQVLALNKLAVKPRDATAFVVDAYANVIGLLGQLPNGFSANTLATLIDDPAHQPNLIARPKFAVLTWRPKDMDPRGTSIANPAYKPWWIKQQVVRDFLKYLGQFASPSLIGFTPDDATEQQLTDALGNPLYGTDGVTPLISNPESDMLAQLVKWQNGSVATFRGGSAIQIVQSSGEGRAFLAALQWCNREIGKALTTQSLATEEGQHDARAAATVHQDALDTLIRYAKRAVERMIRFDIVRRLVLYNFGADAARDLTPLVTLGRTEEHDFRQEAEAVARLWAVGAIGKSQLPALYERLGLPERDWDADERDAQVITMVRPERAVPTSGGQQESQAQAQLQETGGAPAKPPVNPNQRSTEGQREPVVAN